MRPTDTISERLFLAAARRMTFWSCSLRSDFRRLAAVAFNILRQHASLILNLLSLMGDANIKDLAGDVEKNLLKVCLRRFSRCTRDACTLAL